MWLQLYILNLVGWDHFLATCSDSTPELSAQKRGWCISKRVSLPRISAAWRNWSPQSANHNRKKQHYHYMAMRSVALVFVLLLNIWAAVSFHVPPPFVRHKVTVLRNLVEDYGGIDSSDDDFQVLIEDDAITESPCLEEHNEGAHDDMIVQDWTDEGLDADGVEVAEAQTEERGGIFQAILAGNELWQSSGSSNDEQPGFSGTEDGIPDDITDSLVKDSEDEKDDALGELTDMAQNENYLEVQQEESEGSQASVWSQFMNLFDERGLASMKDGTIDSSLEDSEEETDDALDEELADKDQNNENNYLDEVSEREDDDRRGGVVQAIRDQISQFFDGNGNGVDLERGWQGDSDDFVDEIIYDEGKPFRRQPSVTSRLSPSRRRGAATRQESETKPQFPLPDVRIVYRLVGSRQEDTTTDIDVTLVTQCSIDRLGNLKAQLADWDGYASVALYLKCNESLQDALQAVTQLPELDKVAVTVVQGTDEGQCYPINFLRNVALLQARSTTTSRQLAVLLVDVDFCLSRNLHTTLHCPAAAKAILEERKIMVCPAFETTRTQLPKTIADLVDSVDSGDTEAFHVSHFPQGHSPTSFDTFWALTSDDMTVEESWDRIYKVEYQDSFEPYIVMSARDVPLYDERFQGYGLNKVSHLQSVAHIQSNFHVLPGVFLVAAAHDKSESWSRIYGSTSNEVKERQRNLQALYDNFMRRLRTNKEPILTSVTQEEFDRVSRKDL